MHKHGMVGGRHRLRKSNTEKTDSKAHNSRDYNIEEYHRERRSRRGRYASPLHVGGPKKM